MILILSHPLLVTMAAAATLPLNAAYVPQPPPLMRTGGAFGVIGRRHLQQQQQQTTRATVLSDSTTMDFEMNLNLRTGSSLTSNQSLQVETISEDGGQGLQSETTMFDDLMRASQQRQRPGSDAEDAPPGAVVSMTDRPDLLSLELPTSNDGRTVHQMKDAVTQAALAADDDDDVAASATTTTAAADNDSSESSEAPQKKKKKVTATIRETGQDSMKHYLKSMGNHDLLNKNEEIILAREIQILIGWEETRVNLEAQLER